MEKLLEAGSGGGSAPLGDGGCVAVCPADPERAASMEQTSVRRRLSAPGRLGREFGFTRVALLKSHVCFWKDVVQRGGQPGKEKAK